MSPPTTDEQDARDMARLASGHDAALNDLMERHAERLFHYLARCLQDEDDAADLAQETFVKLYQSRARFDPKRKFSTWLYAIASNLVRDRFRWRSRHSHVSLDARSDFTGNDFRETIADPKPSPGENVEAAERTKAVRRAVAALPAELRTPLILAEYEERSQLEIGEILGCTPKAVETRLYRARRQLRASLRKLLELV